MPYDNMVIKKSYYDVDKFGSYVNYKSFERRKRIKKAISKFFAIFDVCLIVGIFVLSTVLIFGLVKYSRNSISFNVNLQRIAELKTDIDILKSKNNVRRNEIAKELNLEEIKKRAIYSLDMVSPTENNTIHFDTND